MRKELFVLSLAAFIGFKAYSQSLKEPMPEQVKKEATEYLKRVAYCDTIPKLEKIGEKFEDRTGDGIKDKITLYHIKNFCEWINVPNYIVYTQVGLKNGGFVNKGSMEGIISKDKNSWKEIPLRKAW